MNDNKKVSNASVYNLYKARQY